MIKNILLIFQIIISIPKTLYFNFRVFKIKYALRIPVYIHYNVELTQIYRNSIDINSKKISTFMIKIGIGGSNAIKNTKSKIYISKNKKGKIIFEGNAKFSNGIVLYVNGGKLNFGDNFSSNKNCFLSCDNKLIFGQNVLLGWNVTIRDSDGHKIIYSEKKEKDNSVIIGNHVWICSNVDILKNTKIGNDCVIGYRSFVTNLLAGNNKLIIGTPAKIIRNSISWEK